MKLISYLISTALAIWAVVGSIFCDYNLNFTITAITKGKEMKKFKVDLKLLQHDEIKIPGRYTCPSNTCFNGEGYTLLGQRIWRKTRNVAGLIVKLRSYYQSGRKHGWWHIPSFSISQEPAGLFTMADLSILVFDGKDARL